LGVGIKSYVAPPKQSEARYSIAGSMSLTPLLQKLDKYENNMMCYAKAPNNLYVVQIPHRKRSDSTFIPMSRSKEKAIFSLQG